MSMHPGEEVTPFRFLSPGLQPKSLPKWIETLDQELVSTAQPLQQMRLGDAGCFVSITAATCQHKVPHTIKWNIEASRHQNVGEEVIHVWGGIV